jgi:hypothetical protein
MHQSSEIVMEAKQGANIGLDVVLFASRSLRMREVYGTWGVLYFYYCSY